MSETWPPLPADEWADTLETFHLWTQVVGKIRMASGPWLNHSWGVTLYVTPRGLTTGTVPHGHEAFEIRFDLIDHELVIETSSGGRETLELRDRPTAEFYAAVLESMARLGVPVRIHPLPSEIAGAIRFDQDTIHHAYEPDHAHLMWRAWLHTERVMTAFRASYVGKSSPAHLYWGGFDLAAYRYSGRTAPPHQASAPNYPRAVNQESYSHELAGAGFWFGSRDRPVPAYFAYAYPAPDGMGEAEVLPTAAAWDEDAGIFALPYEAVRTAEDPDAALTAFLASTYAAGPSRADGTARPWSRTHREDPTGGGTTSGVCRRELVPGAGRACAAAVWHKRCGRRAPGQRRTPTIGAWLTTPRTPPACPD